MQAATTPVARWSCAPRLARNAARDDCFRPRGSRGAGRKTTALRGQIRISEEGLYHRTLDRGPGQVTELAQPTESYSALFQGAVSDASWNREPLRNIDLT